jgi:hypothetical protein
MPRSVCWPNSAPIPENGKITPILISWAIAAPLTSTSTAKSNILDFIPCLPWTLPYKLVRLMFLLPPVSRATAMPALFQATQGMHGAPH